MVPRSGLAERVPEQTEAVLVTQSDPPRSARLGPPSQQVTSSASTRSRYWSRSGLTPDARAPASDPLTRSPRSPVSSRWPARCAVVPAESADELDDHLAIVVDVNAEPSEPSSGVPEAFVRGASLDMSRVCLSLLQDMRATAPPCAARPLQLEVCERSPDQTAADVNHCSPASGKNGASPRCAVSRSQCVLRCRARRRPGTTRPSGSASRRCFNRSDHNCSSKLAI